MKKTKPVPDLMHQSSTKVITLQSPSTDSPRAEHDSVVQGIVGIVGRECCIPEEIGVSAWWWIFESDGILNEETNC